MALKIDQQSEDALTFRIAEGIGGVKDLFFGVHHTDFFWANGVAATLPDALADRISKICGENGLADFIFGQVDRRIDEDEKCDPYKLDALTEIPSLTDTISASKLLVEELRSLPYSYRMSAPLPTVFSDEYYDICDNTEIGTGISIVSGAHLKKDFPTHTGYGRRDRRITNLSGNSALQTPQDDLLYLVQNRSGYFGSQKEPPALADFKTSVRQFLGAALAVKALNTTHWIDDKWEGAYIVHRKDGEAELCFADAIDPTLKDFYRSMNHRRSGDKKNKKDDNRVDLCKRKIEAIKSVFNLNDHGRRLSVASIWYLRSHLSGDTLDALLESTIALEALLGGGTSEGTKLSSLLGNRCAYLIGNSLADRQEILSNFTEIYGLRSRIVHEGHHKFSPKERGLLGYSKELCRRALVKEMTLSPERK